MNGKADRECGLREKAFHEVIMSAAPKSNGILAELSHRGEQSRSAIRLNSDVNGAQTRVQSKMLLLY